MSSPSGANAGRGDQRWAQLVPSVAAVLAYLAALTNGFAYDDVPVVSENPWIRHGVALRHALTLPYWPNGALYRPVTTFTFAFDWVAGHGSPVLFHLGNIVWYAVGVWLVVRLAMRWWPPLPAALAGLLFALHPVHVEAVANIVGRSELLAGVALLGLALIATRRGPVTPARLTAIAVLTALAIGCKETAILAPVIVWAATRARHADPRVEPIDARRIVLASVFGLCVVMLLRVHVLGSIAGDNPHPAFTAYEPVRAMELALSSLPRAASLVLVPQLPRPDYSPTEMEVAHPALALVVLGGAMVVGAVALLVLHARRPSGASFAAVFSVVTFAPVSNIVLHTGVVLAERTLYSPSIGACLLVCAAAAPLTGTRPTPAFARVVAAAGIVIGAISAAFTVVSVPMWRDSESVFQASIERNPGSYRGYYLLAKAREGEGRQTEAHQLYVTAIRLFGSDPRMLSEAGFNAVTVGDTSDAVVWLSAALVRSPASPVTRATLIVLDLRRGDTASARALLRTGVTMFPNHVGWRALLDSLEAGPR